jgi:hypothetical protein
MLAADYPLAGDRGEMTVADVDAAVRLVTAGRQERRPVGFGIPRAAGVHKPPM